MSTSTLRYWPDGFPRMASVFPDGAQFGAAEIRHRTPTEAGAALASLGGGRGYVQPGETLAQLYVDGNLWMSDTRDERRDHWAPRHHAKGEVLIGGLGYGMVALACALKESVEKVTAIEINPDVIRLVTPYLREALVSEGVDPDKLDVIEADIFTWKPPRGQRYQCIWFDVWDVLCTDNLAQYARLNRRFARRTDGYRGAWCEDLLKAYRRRERRDERLLTYWRS